MATRHQPVPAVGFGRGLLLGSIIGALFALWFAPKSGKQTQAYLFKQWSKLRKQATHTGNQLYQDAWETTVQALDQAEKLQQESLAYVKDQGEQWQEQLESTKNKLRQVAG